MSKEYKEFFNTKVNIVDNYDLQPQEAADLGWAGARDAIVKILKEKAKNLNYVDDELINEISNL